MQNNKKTEKFQRAAVHFAKLSSFATCVRLYQLFVPPHVETQQK